MTQKNSPPHGRGGPLWAKLLLPPITVIVTLLALEVGVRIFHPQNLDFYNWTTIKRHSGDRAEPFKYIPGGYNPSYIGVPVSIDSLGLRDREYHIPKPPCVERILGIGDSVAFGFGVPLQDTYLKVLQKKLNKNEKSPGRYEVIDAGAEATGLDYYYEFIKNSAPRLQPDVVLLGITLNDIYNYNARHPSVQHRKRPPVTSRLVREVNAWMLLHSELYLWSYMSLKSGLYHFGVISIESTHAYDFLSLEPPSAKQTAAWKSSINMLTKIVDLCRQRHYRLIVVVFPMEVQLSHQALDLYREKLNIVLGPQALSGDPQRRIAAFCEAHDVPMINPLPAFRASKDYSKLYLRDVAISMDPVHPSILGHRLLANVIYKAVSARNLIKPPECVQHTAAQDGSRVQTAGARPNSHHI